MPGSNFKKSLIDSLIKSNFFSGSRICPPAESLLKGMSTILNTIIDAIA